MPKYAIIRIGGKQYKVEEGQELLVDKLAEANAEAGVLLVADGEKVTVGKPEVKSAKVVFNVVAPIEKGEKIEVYKFKAKSRYKKHTGYRPKLTRIKVEKISL